MAAQTKFTDDRLNIIYEIGANHNGKLNTAKNYVDAVLKQRDIDPTINRLIKIQYFTANKLATRHACFDNGTQQISVLSKAQLQWKDVEKLITYCNKHKIGIGVTVFNEDDVDKIMQQPVAFYKVASPDIISTQMIEKYLNDNKKYTLISTGCSTSQEITNTIKLVKNKPKTQAMIMLCTGIYPQIAFDYIKYSFLKDETNKYNLLLGYSDHSATNENCNIAVKLGITTIEKHVKMTDNDIDNTCAVNIQELSQFEYQLNLALSYKSANIFKDMRNNMVCNIRSRRYWIALKEIKTGTNLIPEYNIGLRRCLHNKNHISYMSNLTTTVAGSNITPGKHIKASRYYRENDFIHPFDLQ